MTLIRTSAFEGESLGSHGRHVVEMLIVLRDSKSLEKNSRNLVISYP